jgi:hypothetical protein
MRKLQLAIGFSIIFGAAMDASAQCPCAAADANCVQVGPALPRITDAVAHARALRAGGVTAPLLICVPPGEYVGSYTAAGGGMEDLPIVVNIPDLTIQGKVFDDAAIPTEADMADAPVLNSDVFLDNQQDLLVFVRTGHTAADGTFVEDTAGDRSRLTGFVVRQPDTTGFSSAVWADRVSGVRMDHSWATSNGCVALIAQSSTVRFDHNLASGNGCGGFGTGGGTVSHPSNITIDHNVATGNGILGAIPAGAAFAVIPPLGAGQSFTIAPWDTADMPDESTLTIADNQFTGNGVTGIRFFGYPPTTVPGQTTSHMKAVVVNNDLSGNGAYGVVVDPGFSHKKDPRTFTYDVDLTLQGNSYAGNPLGSTMFGFLTIWAMLKPDCGGSRAYQVVESSTITVTSSDDLGNFDRYVVGRNNTLTVNGAVIRGSQLPHLLPDLGGFCH